MKLWKWFIKCPMLFLLLMGWLGLTAFTWSEGRMPQKLNQGMIENPVFTALLEPEISDTILDDLDDTLFDQEESEEDLDKESDQKNTVIAAVSKTSKDSKQIQNDLQGSVNHKEAADDGKEIEKKPSTEDDIKNDKKKDKDEQNSKNEEIGVTNFKQYKKKKTDSRYYWKTPR